MKRNAPRTQIRSWASDRLSDDIRRAIDRLARSDDIRHIAIMPDIHLGRDVCIGTAFATTELIYPDAIGGDIGCGMAAAALDASADDLSSERIRQFHRGIRAAVPIQRHRADAAKALAGRVPASVHLSLPVLRATAEAEGPLRLGTLGTGNHFLELQYDEEGRLWLMVHSGSRGLGQAIRAAHADHADHAERSRTGLSVIVGSSPAGQAYLRDMNWARRFAAESRRSMLLAVGYVAKELFGWRLADETIFDCDHNHINIEDHFGTALFVHRKGAMAAFRDMTGIVPGSMAAPSFHVLGRGVAEALCSSAHGAGRAMSRTEARRQVSRQRLQKELKDVYVDPGALTGLREEAPSAYKDIRAVMRAQRKLVRVVRTLTPILTHKGLAR
jgi:tRNA-splicing ligase RtcB